VDHDLPILEARPLRAIRKLVVSVLATLVGAIQVFLRASIRGSFVLGILSCFPTHGVSLRHIVGERSYLGPRLMVRIWLASA
jgi:hypothetical protein